MFGMSWADTFRVLLMGLFILVCIAITIVVLMQESKQTGLSGAISGAADTYWGKNKGLLWDINQKEHMIKCLKTEKICWRILFCITTSMYQ